MERPVRFTLRFFFVFFPWMEDRDCKKLRKSLEGEDVVCYWAPAAGDVALVDALLDAAWKTSFIMKAKTIEDTDTDNLTLAPVGVAFSCPARCVPEQVGEVMVFETEDDAEGAATVDREEDD